MNAWNIDANTISTGEIGSDVSSLMVVTREIKDFLSPETKKMFIVAPKGVGKTFLLKVKSQMFRDHGSGYKFIPEETLCESFTSNDLSFSDNEILKFSERSIWNKTWELCLYTLILKQFKSEDIPKEINNVVGDDAGVLSEILGAFLQVRSNIEKLHSWVAIKLKPAVRKLRDNSTANQVAVFIDNIDESFDSFVGFTAQSEGKLKGSSIWINAQLSLLNVARDICRSNHHIKIFATIRSEAYNNFFDPLKLQIDELCVFLRYTKEQIREIFYKNIRLTATEDLVNPGNDDPLITLFGYHHIPHKFIEDEKGIKRREDVFDFIFRHTYARPRDIVLMGKSIVENLIPKKRNKTNEVGTIINEQSYRLFEQLKNETIPVFEEEIFEKFCSSVKSNVIKFDEAYRIFDLFKQEGFNNIFSYFYRLGLIGVVESDLSNNGGELKQTFLPVGQYSLTDTKVPEFQYFVLHPSLNNKMKQIHDVGFYDRFNIIGYDYPFSSSKINLVDNHFHFGFDRDSITAILPSIQNSKCLAVLVVPSSDWTELDICNTTILNINGEDYSFRIYRDTLSEKEKNEIKIDWKDKRYNVVIYTHSVEEISYFFEKCYSSSLCLFFTHGDLINKLLRRLDSGTNHHIYFFSREYIKSDFDFFANYVQDANKSVTTELILIDRFQISSENQLVKEDELLRCFIIAEGSYNIIYKSRPNSLFKLTDKYTKAYSEDEMDYYIIRQNYLGEGVYHFMKVLFSKGLDDPGEYNQVLQKFINLQSTRILSNYADNKIFNLFNGKNREAVKKELIKFGNETSGRIVKLYIAGAFSASSNDLEDNKVKLFFPSEEEFYDYLKFDPDFYSGSKDFIDLKDILEYKPLKKFRNVFLSYSFKDTVIANTIYERLILTGVGASIYEQDNPTQFNKIYMHSMVEETDKVLLLASKSSLTSDACHFELSQCIEYIRKNNDSDKLLVICLDDYIITCNLLGIVDNQRKINISFLRENASLNNKFEIDNSANFRKIDNWLLSLVEKALLVY